MTASRGTRAATAVLVASLATLALTSLTWERREGRPAVAAVSGPEQAPAPSAPSPPRRPTPRVDGAPAGVAIPVGVRVASVGLRMPVVAKGVSADGQMALPPRPATIGWYRFGPAPGEPGSTVLAGHVDTARSGIGPLARLREVDAGATVTVLLSDGRRARYSTVSVRSVGKQSRALASVFDREGRPRLRIVTCGGEFDADAGGYQDNVVLTAAPVSGPAG